MIRGVYYGSWHRSAARLREAHEKDFVTGMRRELYGHAELQNAEQVAPAVMGVIAERIGTGPDRPHPRRAAKAGPQPMGGRPEVTRAHK
jgi:hypothetical protein